MAMLHTFEFPYPHKEGDRPNTVYLNTATFEIVAAPAGGIAIEMASESTDLIWASLRISAAEARAIAAELIKSADRLDPSNA